MNPDRRPPEALLSGEVNLPYSKGLMAKTLMGAGIRPERAYELARLIEGELVRSNEESTIGAERLYDVAAGVLAQHEGEDAVRLLRRLQALRELDLPIVLLVGGATGTGKSTVATEVAHRLGITRVTSTDTVRQTMRAFFSQKFMPSIHYSSFEAGPAVRIHEGEDDDAALLGFKEQTRNVLVGVKAVIARALEEGYSVAVEGVHLVPGALPRSYEGAVVVQCMLEIEDEDEHARHFWVRDSGSAGPAPNGEVPARAARDPPYPGLPRPASREGRRSRDRQRAHRVGGQRGAPPRPRRGRAGPGAGPSMSPSR